MMAFALGALVAHYEGSRIDLGVYVAGQLFVTSVQLMAQYLNEYWDFEADRLDISRTFFTGGSGVLSEGRVSRATALRAAVFCLVLVAVTASDLILQFRVSPAVWAVMLLGILGGFFYSSPPLRLESTGIGELTASVEVAGLLPAFSYLLFAARPSLLIVLVVAPLVAFHYAMLIAFDLPDMSSDEAGGKKTLLVRVGRDRGISMHNALIVFGFGMAVVAYFAGLPARVAMSLVLTVPLAAFQVLVMNRARRSEGISFQRVTFGAAALFALATTLLAISFWAIG